uniref:Uncharacterized protein n=1 Tax=Anguilla anguilla TaxID=7936 RepID=A0A0E9SLM2_ANGAN
MTSLRATLCHAYCGRQTNDRERRHLVTDSFRNEHFNLTALLKYG